MDWGKALAALIALIKSGLPYLYNALLVLAGKEWQRKIDEAKTEREQREALQHQLEEIEHANKAARLVDNAAHNPDQLERLRQFWRKVAGIR